MCTRVGYLILYESRDDKWLNRRPQSLTGKRREKKLGAEKSKAKIDRGGVLQGQIVAIYPYVRAQGCSWTSLANSKVEERILNEPEQTGPAARK